MRHRNQNKLYGYKQGPRKALIRSLVGSLVENERILTTLVKAKEVRRHVEKAITQAKKQSLHSRRLLLSRFPNQKVVSLMMKKISPRFLDRPGGYTRILKTAPRSGDGSPMAYIEFVDYKRKGSSSLSLDESKKEDMKAKTRTKKETPQEEEKKKDFSFKMSQRKKAVKIKKQQKAQRKMRSLSRKEHRRQKV